MADLNRHMFNAPVDGHDPNEAPSASTGFADSRH